MNHIAKLTRSACVAVIVTLALAAGAHAKEYKLTAGSSHPPIIPWVGTIHDHVVPESNKRLKAMGSSDTIVWTEAYSGALYNFQNTLEGVEEGLADIGWVGTLWEPSKLPLMNVTYIAPFATVDTKLLAKIQDEMHRTIPALNAQWKKYNQVYLGSQTIDDYVIICKSPINTVEDLKGKKFYSPGAIALWLQGTGAIGIDGGLPVYYNGIQTGIADGAILPGSSILPFKLHEVAPYVIEADLGAQISGALTMNLDTWNSLSPQMQDMFKQLGKEYGELVVQRVNANREKHFKILASQGAKFSKLPASEQRKWAQMIPNIAGDWAKREEARGLPAKHVMQVFMESVRAGGGKPLRDWDKGL